MSMQEQMNRFTVAPQNLDIGRSIFDRNHSVKFSFNVGDLVPFYVDEILPGDTFSVNTSKVVRVQPLVTPVMDNLYLDTYYFFVPNRLVWTHWKNFMGESDLAWTPQVEYSIPKITIPSGGFDCGTIADYMGIPIGRGAGVKVNALPFRAYALICSEWFRDTALCDPFDVYLGDNDKTGSNGADYLTDCSLGGKPFKVAKYQDYFTSCLPAPQRTANPVTLPLGEKAPVMASITAPFSRHDAVEPLTFKYQSGDSWTDYVPGTGNVVSLGIGATGKSISKNTDTSTFLYNVAPDNLWADLSNATAASVNDLRFAFAMQKYYEKLARSGDRYISTIKSFFGVDSPDARLQRPEYLGGNRLPLNVAQVENVTNTSTNIEPIGSVAGLSVTGESNSDFTQSFTEHGYIIGVCAVRYHHTYQQGLEPHWLRSTLFDFYNPTFANIGEQPVKKACLYLDTPQAGTNDLVFGYQEAWAEYRFKPNRVASELRSDYSTSLDVWHFADDYNAAPSLSNSWMFENKSNVDRTLAVTSAVSNQLIADFYIECHASRPMPLYSIPGLIDHN